MAKRLRIAVSYNLPSGGAKRALYYHVRGLAERGHTIETWRAPQLRDTFSSFENLVLEHELPLCLDLADGTNYVSKVLRHIRRPQVFLDGIRRFYQGCADEINSGDWDLMLANTDMYVNMPMISRYVSVPKAVYLQEPHRPFYEAQPALPWLALPEEIRKGRKLRDYKVRIRDHFDLANKRIQAREELESARGYDEILVNSLYSRESVFRAYGLDSEVCYLGVDTDQFKDLELPRENIVLGLGAITPQKNVRLSIESLGAMKSPKPTLVWVGNVASRAYVNEMRSLAGSLGVEFQTKVMITDHELLQLLNRASLMFYAPRLEPFGLAPLEANACGLPVVAVAEGGVRETVIDGVNGVLAPHEPNALADAMSSLFNDPVKLRSLGQTGKRLVHEKWNLSSCVDRIENALLRLVG